MNMLHMGLMLERIIDIFIMTNDIGYLNWTYQNSVL